LKLGSCSEIFLRVAILRTNKQPRLVAMRNARAAVEKNIKNDTEPRALTSYDVLECVDVGNEFTDQC
jgi:hypothetical protein